MKRSALCSLSALPLAALLLSAPAEAGNERSQPSGDVASSSSGGGAAAPSAPSCSITSPAAVWKVPVNAPRVPVYVSENSGGKLTPTVTVSPNVEYTLLAEPGTPRPDYSRTLTLKGDLEAGDKFEVTLGGDCANGFPAKVQPFTMTIELVAAAPAPTVLGTLAESPQGTSTLTIDPSFQPYQQVATLSFTRDGSAIGAYTPGPLPLVSDELGVVACVGGACATTSSTGGRQRLRLPATLICKNGRDSGVVEVPLSVQAQVPGIETQPAAVSGSLHVDCTKATDTELGKGTGTAPNTLTNGNAVGTGCSLGAARSQTSGGLTGLLVGIGLVMAARRRKA